MIPHKVWNTFDANINIPSYSITSLTSDVNLVQLSHKLLCFHSHSISWYRPLACYKFNLTPFSHHKFMCHCPSEWIQSAFTCNVANLVILLGSRFYINYHAFWTILLVNVCSVLFCIYHFSSFQSCQTCITNSEMESKTLCCWPSAT
jgi:hypothetical protein